MANLALSAAAAILLKAAQEAERTVGNSITVVARVVSPPIPLSDADKARIYGAEPAAVTARRQRQAPMEDIRAIKSIFVFRAHIADSDWEQNPHRFIPDPCDLSQIPGTSLYDVQKIIDLCTQFTSGHSYKGDLPKVGDWVNVRLNKIRQPGSNGGSWDSANGDFVEMALKVPPTSETEDNCKSMIELFSRDYDLIEREIESPTNQPAPATTPASPAAANTDYPRAWSELDKYLAPLSELLEFIASHEGNYESLNRGSSSDSNQLIANYINPYDGLLMVETKISTLRKYYRGGRGFTRGSVVPPGEWVDRVSMTPDPRALANPRLGPGFLALGKYQIIYKTMASIYTEITGIPDTALYNELNQDKLAATLIISGFKRRNLSDYLLGKSNNATEAAQDMALEWASIPIQYSRTRTVDGKPVTCKRGESAYCGDSAGNASAGAADNVLRKVVAARASIQEMLARESASS